MKVELSKNYPNLVPICDKMPIFAGGQNTKNNNNNFYFKIPQNVTSFNVLSNNPLLLDHYTGR